MPHRLSRSESTARGAGAARLDRTVTRRTRDSDDNRRHGRSRWRRRPASGPGASLRLRLRLGVRRSAQNDSCPKQRRCPEAGRPARESGQARPVGGGPGPGPSAGCSPALRLVTVPVALARVGELNRVRVSLEVGSGSAQAGLSCDDHTTELVARAAGTTGGPPTLTRQPELSS